MVRARVRAGFTLIEAMLVIAILGIVSSLGATLFIQVNRYFILSKAQIALQQEARSVMYVMAKELRQAQSANIIISQAGGQPYYSEITFTEEQGKTVTFLQNGNLLEMVNGSDTQILSKDLYYLAFTFPRSDDMNIVSISLTLETAIYQGGEKALHMASENVQVMD